MSVAMPSPVFPLVGPSCRLRPWTLSDARALVRHANNPHIARQLRDGFPFPYTDADGAAFLQAAVAVAPPLSLAIEVQGGPVGGLGVLPRSGNERRTAEIGYWLSETLWGRGIGTEALRLMTEYAVATFDVARLEAFVMVENTRSCRTLEKAGYQLEGRLRRSFLKDGVLHDQCCYGWIAA